MELIKMVNKLETAMKSTGIVKNALEMITDETVDIPEQAKHVQDYFGWLSIERMEVSTSGKDSFKVTLGCSGISSRKKEDFLQVKAKCAFVLKQALIYTSFIADEDVEEADIILDSQRNEDNVLHVCYTNLSLDLKLSGK